MECDSDCRPACRMDLDLLSGHPYFVLPYHFDDLPCNWQQPDFRPIHFADQTRFPSKEMYGSQCPVGITLSQDKVPPKICCVPKCGCPATHVMPFPHNTATFAIYSTSQPTDWNKLKSLLCNKNVDVVKVMCEGTEARMTLQRFLNCCQTEDPGVWMLRGKADAVVFRPPMTPSLISSYMNRYMWWRKNSII